MRTEIWNGYSIRFVEKEGEWWAVAADVVLALGLKQTTRAIRSLKDGVTLSKVIDRMGREQETNILNEKAIYKLIFKSHKKEAEEFQDWVYEMLKSLRQSTGLEGFQIFRMLDKEHQKEVGKMQDEIKKMFEEEERLIEGSNTEKEQTTIRLTVRTSEEMDKLIRDEAVRRVTNVNQTMLYILNEYFRNQKE